MKEESLMAWSDFEYQDNPSNSLHPRWIRKIKDSRIRFTGDIPYSGPVFFDLIDYELKNKRLVYISLQWGPTNWHMYAIFGKNRDGTYNLVTSLPGQRNCWVEIKDLRATIPTMNGVNIKTYRVFKRKCGPFRKLIKK